MEEFTILTNAIERFIDICGDKMPEEGIYVSEETAELIIELMMFQKSRSKQVRANALSAKVFEEACDVLTTTLMFLIRSGYDVHEVTDEIAFKLNRAVNRYQEDGIV